MKVYKVKIKNLNNPLLVQVSLKKINLSLKKTIFIVDENKITFGHSAYIVTNNIKNISTSKPIIYEYSNEFLNSLEENDILHIFPDGTIHKLWEKKLNNFDIPLFITNQCNAKCVMCPQPPHKDAYSLLNPNKFLLENLKNQNIKRIGITGGEPTVKYKDLITLLKIAYQYYPNADIDLLTNAKLLKDFNLAKTIALTNPNIIFCISFPTDNIDDFNKIMGSDLYVDVLLAIQNLAKLRQNIELRIVIMKQNYKRLQNISEFIFRNFPFVSHIAFMGMEITGYAFDNVNQIYINPNQFKDNLLEAVRFLKYRNMNVSIYNIPYCVLDKSLWSFLRNSISSWKKTYVEECNLCIKKNECSGLFSTTKSHKYEINPIIKL